ncbi:MAG: transp aux protein, partial [Deltaproteobacteria bacterium]|nr:transp aux protein [Deltaproteobacteria bacterium]
MTFFPLARSVEVDRDPSKGFFPLALTSEASWGETDRKALEEGKADYDEKVEKKGPLSIAAVAISDVSQKVEGGDDASGKKVYAKFVVVGNSAFVNTT